MLRPMVDDKIIERLKLSRQTLYGWQAGGGPTGRTEDILRMIDEETDILHGIANKHPETADAVALLVDAYESLAEKLKRRMH